MTLCMSSVITQGLIMMIRTVETVRGTRAAQIAAADGEPQAEEPAMADETTAEDIEL